MRSRRLQVFVFGILVSILLGFHASAGDSGGRILALCAGVGNHSLGALAAPVPDAHGLARGLEALGLVQRAIVLTDANPDGGPVEARLRPTVKNILGMLTLLARSAGPDDTILFFFSGHGAVKDGISCIYPAGTRAGDGLSLDQVAEIMAGGKAAARIILVDASRDNTPELGLTGAQAVGDGEIAVIVSCSDGQYSVVDAETGRGLFGLAVEHVLTGADRREDIWVDELVEKINLAMSEYCLEQFVVAGQAAETDETMLDLLFLAAAPESETVVADSGKAAETPPQPDAAAPPKRASSLNVSHLPPHIQARQYLRVIGEAIKAGDNTAVVRLCEEMFANPDLEMDPEFKFYYARALLAVGRREDAAREAGEFLNTDGVDEELVDEALGILERVQRGDPLALAKELLGPTLKTENYLTSFDFKTVAGREEEFREAVALLKTAVQDNAASKEDLYEAYALLLLCHLNGPLKDPAEASRLLHAAVEAGSPRAQYILARNLKYGDPATKVQQNEDEAMPWLILAADNGFPPAKGDLAQEYLRGWGTIKKDVGKAVALYREIIDPAGKNPQYMLELARIYLDKYAERGEHDGDSRYFRPDEGLKLMRTAAELGDVFAMYSYGDILYEGRNVAPNPKGALEWYLRMIEAPDASDWLRSCANFALGRCYFEGKGALQDYVKARELFGKVDFAGDVTLPEPYYYIGYLAATGAGGAKLDYAKAVEYYEKAATSPVFAPGGPSAKAMHELAHVYKDYRWPGISPDTAKAAGYLKKTEFLSAACSVCQKLKAEAEQKRLAEERKRDEEKRQEAARQAAAAAEAARRAKGTATVKTVFPEDYHAYTASGQEAIKFHIEFTVQNRKGQKIEVILLFYHANGEKLIFTPDHASWVCDYHLSNNHAAVWSSSTPTYDDSVYNDYHLTIPCRIFPDGLVTRQYKVEIRNSNNETIGESTMQSFTFNHSH